MRGLIEAGYVYIAQPPLYQVKSGRTTRYAYSDRELDEGEYDDREDDERAAMGVLARPLDGGQRLALRQQNDDGPRERDEGPERAEVPRDDHLGQRAIRAEGGRRTPADGTDE